MMTLLNLCIFLLSLLMVSSPHAADAFWGNGSDERSGLNLETGYDANTVATVTGRVVALQTGDDSHNTQMELDNNGARVVVILGPQRYWSENGIVLNAGDDITVRGSKAQGKDGVVYILAQKVTDLTQSSTVLLRDESGRPAWAGSGSGRMNNRPAHSPQR